MFIHSLILLLKINPIIYYNNPNFPSYSLFSKCFSWFFYLGVHRGTGVFSWFFFHSSSRAWLDLALASRLPPFDRKTLKNCACSADPGLFNETKGSWFPLSCFFLYTRVFHFVIKKRKRALRPDSFFFLMILTFFKNILILIITSLAIHYSQNVFLGFSILVCIGVQVCFRSCIFHSSSRAWLALAPASRLPPFDRKTLKNYACSADPGLLNET